MLTSSTARQVDWNLEIITDNEVPAQDIPQPIELMIKNSVNTRTPVCVDAAGFLYPGVTPTPPDKEICNMTALVVKSVIQYAVADNDYVVEMSVYRRWVQYSPEPEISAGVSMYHPDWDYKMRSIGKTSCRTWDDPLKTFFGHGFAENEVVEGSKGVDKFLAEVETVQGFLVDASKEAEDFRKQREAMERQNQGVVSLSSAGQQTNQENVSEVDDLYNAN